MILITGFLLGALLIMSYTSMFYKILIKCVLPCIKVYLYLLDTLIVILPQYIYSKTYVHRTLDLDYTVYEYWYKSNKKYYKFKGIEDNKYKFKDACKIYHPNNMNLINHCCIIDNNGLYIRDITKEIRCFMYYRGLIEWKYILTHLDIDKKYKLELYMNDLNMTEKSYDVRDIYNEKFNF